MLLYSEATLKSGFYELDIQQRSLPALEMVFVNTAMYTPSIK